MKEALTKLLLPSVLGLLRRVPKLRARQKAGLLIFKPDRIGDFVLAAECIRRIRDQFALINCSVVVSEPLVPLAGRELSGVSVLSLPVAQGSFFLSLIQAWQWGRKHLGPIEWDMFVNLRYHLTLREDLVLASVRSEESYGVARGLNANSWPSRLSVFRPSSEIEYPDGRKGQPSELVAHERLLQILGCESAPYKPRLKSWKSETLNYLLLCPFSSEKIKNYPIGLLVEAFSQATLPDNLRIRICAESQCAGEAMSLGDKLSLQTLVRTEVVTPSDIAGFIDCVASARAVVAMDSAAAHIAIALGKPGVFVVGGGHYGSFAPWAVNVNQHWVTNQLPCFGCDWQCVRATPECITEIPAAVMAQKITSTVKL